MFTYLGIDKTTLKCVFRVTGNDRFRVLQLHQEKIIEKKYIEYNTSFSQVVILVNNPFSQYFVLNKDYWLLLNKKGIECVWDSFIPKYVKQKLSLPATEIKKKLNININETLQSSESEQESNSSSESEFDEDSS
jgi:hypothetical protein